MLLGLRFIRSRRDPLAVAAVLVGVPFAVAWVFQRGSLGRVFPGLILLAHLAMADWFAQKLRTATPKAIRRSVQAALAMLIVAGLTGTAAGWRMSVPRAWVSSSVSERLRLESSISPYLGFGDYMSIDDVAVVPPYLSLAVGGSSAKVVAVEINGRWIEDQDRRAEDSRSILDPSTSAARRNSLLRKYGVDFVVIESDRASEMVGLIPGSRLNGHVDRFAVIAVPARS